MSDDAAGCCTVLSLFGVVILTGTFRRQHEQERVFDLMDGWGLYR